MLAVAVAVAFVALVADDTRDSSADAAGKHAGGMVALGGGAVQKSALFSLEPKRLPPRLLFAPHP